MLHRRSHVSHWQNVKKVWWSGDHVRTKHRESTWNTVNSTSCHPKKKKQVADRLMEVDVTGAQRSALPCLGMVPFTPTRTLLYGIFNIWQWFRYTAPLNVHRTMDPTAALFSITARDGLGVPILNWKKHQPAGTTAIRAAKACGDHRFFPIISYLPIRRCSIQSW